jgi:hypothetical protein
MPQYFNWLRYKLITVQRDVMLIEHVIVSFHNQCQNLNPFICGLFNDDRNCEEDWLVNDGFEKILRESVVAYFNVQAFRWKNSGQSEQSWDS